MKTICKRTGITLMTAPGFQRWAKAAVHPIFTISLEEVLTIAATEWSPSLPEQEKKLLLLSIAANCDLLQWSEKEEDAAPAMPSLSIIESSIHNLIKIAGWIDAERYANRWLHYPSFHITTATASMATFPDMLHRIIETRSITLAAEKRQHRINVLENAARNLSAKCRIGANKEGALLRITAEWAMQVCNVELRKERVSVEIQNDWKEMLQTSPTKLKASRFSITDVHELRDFMLEYLPHGSIIAYDVIAHLNRLVECNIINDVDHGDILAVRIVKDTLDAASNSNTAATEPQRNQFPDMLSYARAKASWIMQRAKEESIAEEALKKATLEARAKIANRNGEQSDEI